MSGDQTWRTMRLTGRLSSRLMPQAESVWVFLQIFTDIFMMNVKTRRLRGFQEAERKELHGLIVCSKILLRDYALSGKTKIIPHSYGNSVRKEDVPWQCERAYPLRRRSLGKERTPRRSPSDAE